MAAEMPILSSVLQGSGRVPTTDDDDLDFLEALNAPIEPEPQPEPQENQETRHDL